MRKKLSDFSREFESQCRHTCLNLKVDFRGIDGNVVRLAPTTYQKLVSDVEERVMSKSKHEVEQ